MSILSMSRGHTVWRRIISDIFREVVVFTCDTFIVYQNVLITGYDVLIIIITDIVSKSLLQA